MYIYIYIELTNLKTKPDLREKQLSALVCAAFEDAKVSVCFSICTYTRICTYTHVREGVRVLLSLFSFSLFCFFFSLLFSSRHTAVGADVAAKA